MESRGTRTRTRDAMLFGIKAFHSLAFFAIQSAILVLLYTGIIGRSDRRAAVAAAIAVGESAIYVGNGFRCPLTSLAESLGSEHGHVTDIFLTRWLASNIARIYTPILAAAMLLHARNIRRNMMLRKPSPMRGR